MNLGFVNNLLTDADAQPHVPETGTVFRPDLVFVESRVALFHPWLMASLCLQGLTVPVGQRLICNSW